MEVDMRITRIGILLLATIIVSYVASFAAETIPAGPWNYANGVWVKVDLPDSNSPYEWVPGHWTKYGKWAPGHWKRAEYSGNEAVSWISGYWNPAGKWVPGHWKKLEAVSGKVWMPGHWKNHKWVAGYWEVSGSGKAKVWVPKHRDINGRLVPGHWEYR
jgi:hypothetical protein